MNKKLSFLLVLLVFSAALTGCAASNQAQSDQSSQTGSIPQDSLIPVSSGEQSGQNQPNNQTTQNMTNSDRPQMVIDQKKTYLAVMHTDQGDIEIALNAKSTPITANNFISLAKKNFYDNTIFHRVIKGFMIQGGDPKGDGTGGPGYTFDDEPFTGEYTRGTIAMANAGPNTNGSQFFIMHQSYPLPKNYVIFGQVTKGMDVVDKIAEAPVTNSPSGEMSQPLTPVKIKSIEIIEK